jgi:hypothetical protein
VNTKYSVQTGVIGIVCAVMGNLFSPQNDYLKLNNQNTHFYINKNQDLIQIVSYDTDYVNPYMIEQVLLYFGHSPKSVYYYEKCNNKKTYMTLSGYKFKC